MARGSNIITATDRSSIMTYISNVSQSVYNLLQDDSKNDPGNNYKYLLIKKNITHSDVITAGKGNEKTGVAKNYLYYLTTKEMEEIEHKEHNSFIRTAHQSNISLPQEFYEFLNIPQIQRRVGQQQTQHHHPIVNDYAKVLLVNDSMKYFDISYTEQVFQKLGKNPDWDYPKLKVNLSEGNFTSIQLTYAVHGIGTEKDEVFHKLRHSIFRSDSLILLLRNAGGKKSLYIMLEKNPRFFTIIGEGNQFWENYLKHNDQKHLYELLKKEKSPADQGDVKTRQFQSQWRQMLAKEMMNYTPNDNGIFCPLTYISADFTKAGALFVASHIKEYANCDMNEAFDINNGILMAANADALFDKHLITIKDDGTIVFSFLIDDDYKLKTELKLNGKVFESILNPDRCKYLAYHRQAFKKEEEKRRKASSSPDNLIDA